jgi:hypothetical protein
MKGENSRSRHTLAVDNVVVRGMQRPGKSSRDQHGGKWMPDRRDEILHRDEEDLQRLIVERYQGTHRTNPRRTDHQHPLRYQYQRSVSRIRPRLSATQPDRQRRHISALERLLFVTRDDDRVCLRSSRDAVQIGRCGYACAPGRRDAPRPARRKFCARIDGTSRPKTLIFCWRPRRDLNPCYRRERPVS